MNQATDSVTVAPPGRSVTAEDLLAPVREELIMDSTAVVRNLVQTAWQSRAEFVRWPQRERLFSPTAIRKAKWHTYTAEQLAEMRVANVKRDERSNGPAVMAYLLAGGERPIRRKNTGWSIHHIYDGNHPFPGRHATVRAVIDGSLFTQAAGLVAVHPVADALADSNAYFAWLLRAEAFLRFGHDPDKVLAPLAPSNGFLQG
jgi:hypothetical protein